ncbi:MAG TPA: hypothetical protein VGI92_12990 [Gemmatimonadales bacterium]|jgi:hypothetical protein
MPEGASRLPERPSLEQLRKQAKDLLKQLRLDHPEATLADAQLEIARRFGFASWPKLVHHVESLPPAPTRLDQFEAIAAEVHRVYRPGDEAAVRRLAEVLQVSFSPQTVRVRVKQDLDAGRGPGSPFLLDDARALVARSYGFASWDKLSVSLTNAPTDSVRTPLGLSTAPPFYRIDWHRRSLQPLPPLSARDWQTIFSVMKEHGLTRLDAAELMIDEAMPRLAELDQVTELYLGGSKRLTDAGAAYLARMPQLEVLDLGGQITDRGLASLGELANLREFSMNWARGISDAGMAHLRACDALERVDVMGSTTGDGVIAAMAGKPKLREFKTGRLVTDAGLPLLHQIPAFKKWQGVEPELSIMSFQAEGNHLMIDGPFSDAGLRALRGLDGLFGLGLFWHTTAITRVGLETLHALPHLGHFNCRGELANDAGMAIIGALPHLRMLSAQEAVAGDDGFAALARSKTLEYFWGRECPNLGTAGFAALASMPTLKGIGVDCSRVGDEALALLPALPSLRQIVPMGFTDDGFRQLGACANLEDLWCMYCRETGDVGTSYLAGLKKLRMYYAGSTHITDGSLAILGRIDSLEKLEFWMTDGVTDAGLRHLTRLPRLREIELACPHITREGAAVFPPTVRVTYHST